MTRVLSPFVLVVCLLAVCGAAPDVISVIKPNRSGAAGSQLGVPLNGRFTAANVSVADLIAAAYGGALPLDVAHITGLPPWARSERFDIDARSDAAAPTEDSEDDAAIHAAFAMVQSMLAERFQLVTHDSRRQEPIYALVQARAARRPGLKPTGRECDAIEKAGPFSSPPAGVDASLWVPCGVRVRLGEILSAGGTLDQLARHLAPLPGIERTVVDRTGIAGRVDFTLAFVPPQPPPNRDGRVAVTDNGPSIFTALQEQLGLKLESTRGPVRVLVIDRLERPTPN